MEVGKEQSYSEEEKWECRIIVLMIHTQTNLHVPKHKCGLNRTKNVYILHIQSRIIAFIPTNLNQFLLMSFIQRKKKKKN